MPPRSSVTTTSSLTITDGCSRAVTDTGVAAVSSSPIVSSSTSRITCGSASLSVSVSSVPSTVSPGVVPSTVMVSSISRSRSSTGVSISVVLPVRWFAGIVTVRVPLIVKSSLSTALPPNRSVTGIARGRTWSLGLPNAAVTVTVRAPSPSPIDVGDTDSTMPGPSRICRSAPRTKFAATLESPSIRTTSARGSLTRSSTAVTVTVVLAST